MATQPSLDRLKSQLLTSGLQERNNSLYQVINQLIDNLRQNIDSTQGQISAIISGSTGAVGPRGPQGIPGAARLIREEERPANQRIIPALPGDFYEHFPWTPTLISSGGGVPTYSTQTGQLIRIGNLIQATFFITLTALGTLAAGTLSIGNLPYLVNNFTPAGTPQVLIFASLALNYIYVYNVAFPATNTAILRVVGGAATNNVTNMQQSDLTAATILAGAIIYTRD